MPTREEHISLGRKAVELYTTSTDKVLPEECTTEDRALVFGDLLADLMHYAWAAGIDFDQAIEQARFHYKREVRFPVDQQAPCVDDSTRWLS